jgi:hypothetical protein
MLRGFVCIFLALPLAGIALFPCPAHPPATPPPAPPPRAPPPKQLGDDSWQLRQKAQDQLVRLGPDIRDRLAQALKQTTDEEVRTRIEAIIRQIDESRATGTSFITLHLKKASPKDAFAELAKQANAPIRAMPANLWESRTFDPKDIDLDHQPFWLAMKALCNTFGVVPQVNGMDHDLLVGDRNNGAHILGQAPAVTSGPFMVCATTINRRNYVDLNQPQNIQRNCSVQIMVLAEPKIRVLQGSWAARIDQAVDEKGNSIAMPLAGNEGIMNPGNSWMWNMTCNLVPKSGGGEKIARLKGSGHFLVQTRAESAEIPDVQSAKNVTRALGGKQLILKELRKTADNAYEAHVSLQGWAPAEWNLMFNNTLKLVDAKGNALLREMPNMTAGGANGQPMEMKIPFKRTMWNNGEVAGDPVKLIWEVPTETKEVTVPFEFTNLPLP